MKTQDLFQELGLEKLPVERQAALLAQMTEVLLKKIALAVAKSLSDEELAELSQLQLFGDAGKVHDFLEAKIDDYEQLVANQVKELKEDIKADIVALQ